MYIIVIRCFNLMFENFLIYTYIIVIRFDQSAFISRSLVGAFENQP